MAIKVNIFVNNRSVKVILSARLPMHYALGVTLLAAVWGLGSYFSGLEGLDLLFYVCLTAMPADSGLTKQ